MRVSPAVFERLQENHRAHGSNTGRLPGTRHTYHLYVILAKQRDALKKYLDELGIETSIHYPTALPFLEAMLPAQTPQKKTAAATKTRLCTIEMVHGSSGSTGEGTRLRYWSPENTTWSCTDIRMRRS